MSVIKKSAKKNPSISSSKVRTIKARPTIGVFDSGVGGLTVAAAIVKRIPQAEVIYFGDSARVPYGNKSKANIIAYSEECVKFLIKKGADIIVIACNTSSAVAVNHLRKKFIKLPILGVIDPGVISAVTAFNSLKNYPGTIKTGVTLASTFRTASSHIYKKKIQLCKPETPVYEIPCPLLVPIIEEGMKNQEIIKPVIKKYLASAIQKSRVLVLGCTHYPLIKNIFKATFPKVVIVDSAETTARYLAMLIEHGKITFDTKNKLFKNNNLINRLPLAQMVFNVNKVNKKKLSYSKKPIAIYTNDRNEVFVAIAKKLFPKIKVKISKLKID